MEKMILFIWLLITLHNYSCNAVTNNGMIENVYIDSLIQRYLSDEKNLWDSIYSNSSDRSQKNVNFMLNQIRLNHDEILQDRYLEYVMSVTYMSKFIKYVDFYNIQNYVEDYQHHTMPRPESVMTLDMTFSVYNYSRQDQLFEEIYNVSAVVLFM